MIKSLTVDTVCGNRIKSLIYEPQGLGFNDCLVPLHHPGLYQFPHFTPDSSEKVAMSSHLMNQSPKDQFLNWRQEIEKKQEE